MKNRCAQKNSAEKKIFFSELDEILHFAEREIGVSGHMVYSEPGERNQRYRRKDILVEDRCHF